MDGKLSSATANATYERIYGKTALTSFWERLANRATAPVDILFLGTSFIEGNQAGSWLQRVDTHFVNEMRLRYPTSGVSRGGAGYKSIVEHQATFSDTPVTLTGTSAVSADFGLGLKCWNTSTSGAKAVYTLPVGTTGVDILYVEYVGGGTIYWKVDAGANTNVSTSITGPNPATQRIQIRGMTAGSAHTVEVGQVSGLVFVEGMMIYAGDETSGIRGWNCGRGSSDTSTWTNATNKANWLNSVGMIDPALVFIEILGNDVTQSGLTKAVSKANLQTMITDIRTKCTGAPTIVLNIPYEYGAPGGTNTRLGHNAIPYELAAADPLIMVYDMRRRIGKGPFTANNYAVAGDNIHPSAVGNHAWAEEIAVAVAPDPWFR
jgi:lysophospholipase L1-like esterase